MPAKLEAEDLAVLADLIHMRGGTHADVVAVIEALSPKGRAKRRLLRLLRVYVVAAYRSGLADEPAKVLLNRAVAEVRGWVGPTWSEVRELVRLEAAGHSYPCARRSIWIGECSCDVGHLKVGTLPRHATLARFGTTSLHPPAEIEPQISFATLNGRAWVDAEGNVELEGDTK